ncbi:hypothetical protein Pfo_008331, partial [Paulownia fortunei]
KENVALPKFGSWDVNNPAAAGQYSVIFDRARNEKRAGQASQERRPLNQQEVAVLLQPQVCRIL